MTATDTLNEIETREDQLGFLHTTPIIDIDSHLIEPPDLWTSRLPRKWSEEAPRVARDENTGEERWVVGGRMITGVGNYSLAGWREWYPSHPLVFDDCDRGAWEVEARLARMDEYGIYAQLMYGNLLAFHGWAFQRLDPELRLACVMAYNDYQHEFCSADPSRLIPLIHLPYWSLDESIAEVQRCYDLGFKGVNFGWRSEKLGLPRLRDTYWDPLLSAIQEAGLPMNFHTAFNTNAEDDAMSRIERKRGNQDILDGIGRTAITFVGNLECIAELIMSGLCHRYPRMKFVSVESGFGHIPYMLEALDWQFINGGGASRSPERLMPSEYFRRQIYASFWFEVPVREQLEAYSQNVVFESDYPHSTSLSPGPCSAAKSARETIVENLRELPEDLVRKVLYQNAASLYNLDPPPAV